MASTIKEFFRIFSSKEGLNGFIFAIWIIVTILTSFGWFLGIESHGQTTTYWARVDSVARAFVIFRSDNPNVYLYQLYITSIGANAGSIIVKAEQINGWSYTGTYYIGDTIALGDFRVMIKSINLDRTNPVELEYFQVYDLKPLLTIVFIILTIILASRVVNLGGQRRKGKSKES
jgi:hypothetical protein